MISTEKDAITVRKKGELKYGVSFLLHHCANYKPLFPLIRTFQSGNQRNCCGLAPGD
jgi:hypothetical protein